MRLATVLQMMAPNDPHRAIVARLYEQLGQLPPGAVLHNADRGMMSIMRAAVAQPEQNRGASQADIEALPTRIFHAPASASGSGAAAASSSTAGGDADDSTKERFTCMVSGRGDPSLHVSGVPVAAPTLNPQRKTSTPVLSPSVPAMSVEQ